MPAPQIISRLPAVARKFDRSSTPRLVKLARPASSRFHWPLLSPDCRRGSRPFRCPRCVAGRVTARHPPIIWSAPVPSRGCVLATFCVSLPPWPFSASLPSRRSECPRRPAADFGTRAEQDAAHRPRSGCVSPPSIELVVFVRSAVVPPPPMAPSPACPCVVLRPRRRRRHSIAVTGRRGWSVAESTPAALKVSAPPAASTWPLLPSGCRRGPPTRCRCYAR